MICYVTEGKNTFKKNWITKNSRGKKGHEKVIKIYEEFIVSTTNTGLLECLAENDDGVLSSEMNKIVKFYHNFKKKCFRLDLIYKNLQNENYTILIFYRISNISWTRTQICSILFDRWHSRHFQIRHIRNLSCKSSLVQVPARMRGSHSSMLAGHTCSTDTGPLALVALKIRWREKKLKVKFKHSLK